MGRSKKITETKYLTNAFGVTIKVCCASCQFRQLKTEQRTCEKKKRAVESSEVCLHWKLGDRLKDVGKTKGKVQRRQYQKFLLEIREKESRYKEMGLPIKAKTLDEIHAEFETRFGSRFMDLGQ